MSSRPELKLDWCSYEAAKFAVEHWHYSRRMPVGTMVKIGVWEAQKYIGCVLFARGANHALGDAYGLEQTEICELVRVALTSHVTPVSRIVAIALKFLQKQCPGLRLVVSYADTEQGHHGGIYQAGNWLYVGRGMGSKEFFHEGRWKHNREVTAGAFGNKPKHADRGKGLPSRVTQGKHKYLMSLDAEMKAKIEPLCKPYPKRAASIDSDASGFQSEQGGAKPTVALQFKAKKNDRQRMARPLKEIDPKQVELLAGCGCTVPEIAAKLDCDPKTLRNRFSRSIETGRLNGLTSLRGKQFERAMKGSDSMLIWLGKQLLNQRDKSDVNVTTISDEELEAEVRRRIRLAAHGVGAGQEAE